MPGTGTPTRWSRSRRLAVVAIAVGVMAVPIVTLSVAARQARNAEAAARGEAAVARARADELARRLADAEARAGQPPADGGMRPVPGPTVPIPLAPPNPDRRVPPRPPADVPDVRGVVKTTRVINGTAYATVSVGASQRVAKGMEFKVVEDGNFLAYIAIDAVEPDEAVGHLTGPSVDRVKPGVQVRTAW